MITVIQNARLISYLTEGYSESTADIFIKDDLIDEILPCGKQTPPAGATVIDVAGKTVMPGLFDLHCHLYLQSQTCNTDVIMKNPSEEMFDCWRYSLEYMKQGFTTLRDVGGTMEASIYLRDAINRGDLKGPRIIASGLIMTPTEVGNKTFPLLYAVADSPDALRETARKELEKGADFLKYMGTGAVTNKGGAPASRIATVAELQAVQEVAEMKLTHVAVHCHATEGIEKCVEVGIRTVEHGSLIEEKAIDMLVKSGKTFVIPTFSIFTVIYEDPVTGLMANGSSKKDIIKHGFDCLANAYKAGLKLGWGTDIVQTDFIARPGLEFYARKKYSNYSNKDMLLQATKNSAEIICVDDKLGTVKAGKIADLIVVDGNPDEEIEAMMKPMLHVFSNGKKMI